MQSQLLGFCHARLLFTGSALSGIHTESGTVPATPLGQKGTRKLGHPKLDLGPIQSGSNLGQFRAVQLALQHGVLPLHIRGGVFHGQVEAQQEVQSLPTTFGCSGMCPKQAVVLISFSWTFSQLDEVASTNLQHDASKEHQ